MDRWQLTLLWGAIDAVSDHHGGIDGQATLGKD